MKTYSYGFSSLPDCPKCKYGTPLPLRKDPATMKCIDCGFEFPREIPVPKPVPPKTPKPS